MAGQLPQPEQAALESHLASCAACRKEFAFLQALRLGAAAEPGSGGDHLSDEALAALVDGALDPAQHERALGHLARCTDCLAAAAALQRALAEVGPEPARSPPAALLERAARRGAAGQSTAAAEPPPAPEGGWFEKLFGASFGWRLGLAAGAAAVVLLVSVLLVDTGPGPQPAGPEVTGAPRVAAPGPQQSAPEPPAAQAPPDTAATAVADAPPDPAPAQAARPHPDGPPAPATEPARPARPQATLAARVQPGVQLPAIEMGQALDSRATGFGDGYALGRALGFLERFGPWVDRSPAVRRRVTETLQALEPALESALAPGDRRQRLVRFAAELSQSLATDDIAAQTAARRLAVLCQALREALADRSPPADGLQLGLLVQGWKTTANARQLGLGSETAPDAAAIERARAIIRRQPTLAGPSQRAALENLDRIERTAAEPPPAQRSERILQQIGQLDAQLTRSR